MITRTISDFSTAELLREAATREDIQDENGILSNEAFDLVRGLVPLSAVDSIIVRDGEGPLTLGFIRRNTGF